MTTESDRMKDGPVRPVIDDELLDRLMAQVDAEGLELLGPEGILTELTSRMMNRALEVCPGIVSHNQTFSGAGGRHVPRKLQQGANPGSLDGVQCPSPDRGVLGQASSRRGPVATHHQRKETQMNGSIQHRPERDSNPWRARYRGPDGREHSKTLPRKFEAETWLRAQLSAADRGDWLDPFAGHLPFSEWVARWQAQRRHLAPATAARDTSLLASHVIAPFSDRRLADITQEEVGAWVAELSTRLSPTTIRKTYELFSASMEAAVTAGRIGRSPCREVKLPLSGRPRRNAGADPRRGCRTRRRV